MSKPRVGNISIQRGISEVSLSRRTRVMLIRVSARFCPIFEIPKDKHRVSRENRGISIFSQLTPPSLKCLHLQTLLPAYRRSPSAPSQNLLLLNRQPLLLVYRQLEIDPARYRRKKQPRPRRKQPWSSPLWQLVRDSFPAL